MARLSELSHSDWLEMRRKGIGGSDAAAIAGMSQYSSAFSVYLDKLGKVPEAEDNLAMLIGRELEDTVARLWEAETGKKVHRSGFMWQSSTRAWQIADVDRMVQGENAGLECKTTSSTLNIKKLKNGEFPDNYYAQCVHYMAVTGADRWYLAVLELGFTKKFHTFVVERDEEEISALCELESAFWHDNVLAGKEPAPDGDERTSEYIKSEYADVDEEEVVGLHGHEEEIAEYLGVKEQIKTLEKSAKALEQTIQLAMGTAATGLARGYTVNWRQYSRAGGIGAKKLAAEYPEAHAACVKPDTKYRRFDIKEDK